MHVITADIVGHWKSKEVWINGKHITLRGFLQDLKTDEQEHEDNADIIKECKGAQQFSWGDTSQGTYCFSLACCFYLNVKWVMDRFFKKELEQVQQRDIRLIYDNKKLQVTYEMCEDLFAQEFGNFMEKLGAEKLDEKGAFGDSYIP